MARGQPSTSARPNRTPDTTDVDRLQATLEQLSQNVRVLTDIVDAIREDLSWLTRNGVSHQPVTVFVHRMPHVPAPANNGSTDLSRGSLELSLAHWPVRDPTVDTLSDDPLRTAVIDDVVQRLAEPIGQLAQDQLNVLVGVVDHAHRELLKAIRHPQPVSPAKDRESKAPSPSKQRRRRTEQQPPEPGVPTTPIHAEASEAPITAVESTVSTDPPPPRGRLF